MEIEVQKAFIEKLEAIQQSHQSVNALDSPPEAFESIQRIAKLTGLYHNESYIRANI